MILYTIFQSTPPRGRRRTLFLYAAAYKADFNPLRREGGDADDKEGTPPHYHISIHSAARAETQCDTETGMSHIISIHSAARAETPPPPFLPVTISVFQSTPPRGRRQGHPPALVLLSIISIHSAARAETRAEAYQSCVNGNFNPLRREGGDSNNTQ